MKNIFHQRNIFLLSFSIITISGLFIASLNVQADDDPLRDDIKQVIILWGDPSITDEQIVYGIEHYIRVGAINVANAQETSENDRARITFLENEISRLDSKISDLEQETNSQPDIQPNFVDPLGVDPLFQEQIDGLRLDLAEHLANEPDEIDVWRSMKPHVDNYMADIHLIPLGGDTVNPIFEGKVYTKQNPQTSVNTYHSQSCDDGDYILGGGGYVAEGNYLRESRPADNHTWFIAGSDINGNHVPIFNFTILCLDVKTEGFSGEFSP